MRIFGLEQRSPDLSIGKEPKVVEPSMVPRPLNDSTFFLTVAS